MTTGRLVSSPVRAMSPATDFCAQEERDQHDRGQGEDGKPTRQRRVHTVPTPPYAVARDQRRSAREVVEYFATGLAMVFKLLQGAQEHWRYVNGAPLVALVRAGAKFEKRVLVERPCGQSRCCASSRGEAPEPVLVWHALTQDQLSGWHHAPLFCQHLRLDPSDAVPGGRPGSR